MAESFFGIHKFKIVCSAAAQSYIGACAGFVCWTLVLCLVIRILGTFLQTFVVNWFRNHINTINYQVSNREIYWEEYLHSRGNFES